MGRGFARALLAVALFGCGGTATPQTEPAPEQSIVEDASLRVGLDDIPDDMLADLVPVPQSPDGAHARIPKQAVNPTGVQWEQNVVTVAFNGGSEEVRALIEAAAGEWTAHSRTFRFSFRDTQGRFRQWRPTDASPAADIRIGFITQRPDGRPDGYWSRIGLMATDLQFSPLSRPTMNLAGFDTKLAPFVGEQNRNAWLHSYLHSVVLHEFGHALGLAHEHFHPDCQRDIKLEDDTNYAPRQDPRGIYIADAAGRQPGAVRSFRGFPNFWSEENARFNLSATTYFQATQDNIRTYLATRSSIEQSAVIDRRSVMMYALEFGLLRSGAGSICVGTGDGRFSDGTRYATRLSDGDIAYFRRYYNS